MRRRRIISKASAEPDGGDPPRADRGRRTEPGGRRSARDRDRPPAIARGGDPSVIDQAPKGVDLFDAGIAYGEQPRLFIDMIGFVEMAQ